MAVFSFSNKVFATTPSISISPGKTSASMAGFGFDANTIYDFNLSLASASGTIDTEEITTDNTGHVMAFSFPTPSNVSAITPNTHYNIDVLKNGTGSPVISQTFYTLHSAPTITFVATPASIPSGNSSSITWTSTDSTSCTGTGTGFAGALTPTYGGSKTISGLTATSNYTISCTGSGGTTTKSLTITVGAVSDPSLTGYYYTTSVWDHPKQFSDGTTGQTDCNTNRKSTIWDTLIAKNGTLKISQCKLITGHNPTDAELAPLEDLATANTTDFWWYESADSSNHTSYHLGGPFQTPEKCKADSDTQNQTLLDKPCFPFKGVPEITANGVTLTPLTPMSASSTNYVPIAPVNTEEGNCTQNTDGTISCIVDTSSSGGGFGKYFNFLIKFFIGICAVLAMLMIVYGGIEYMTGEAMSEKADGKGKIVAALMGLLLAVGAYAILNTINPQLLDLGLGQFRTITVKAGNTEVGGTNGGAPNGNCNPSIASATTASSEILAKAPGAQGASCFGGAMASYVAAGYALGAKSAGCPTSVEPGDVLQIHNGNSATASGDHNVIFDSKLSDGSWKTWSQAGSPPNKMSAKIYSASEMSKMLEWSWKPYKCPNGASMTPDNNNAKCN